MTKFLGKATTVIFSLLLLAACGTTKVDTSAQDQAAADAAAAAQAQAQAAADAAALAERDRLAQEAKDAIRQNRTIYFDFDKSNVKDEFRDLIQAHAEYLAKNPSTNVKLEGHADERGTPEYNIALGEERAKALAEIFATFGVSSSQMETISLGEEKPVDMGHNEDAWAKNRRVEIIYN
jgi:peptidoglycan-associated lipoprotein